MMMRIFTNGKTKVEVEFFCRTACVTLENGIEKDFKTICACKKWLKQYGYNEV